MLVLAMSQGAAFIAPSTKKLGAMMIPNHKDPGSSRSHAALCSTPSISAPIVTNAKKTRLTPVSAAPPDVDDQRSVKLRVKRVIATDVNTNVIQKPAMSLMVRARSDTAIGLVRHPLKPSPQQPSQ